MLLPGADILLPISCTMHSAGNIWSSILTLGCVSDGNGVLASKQESVTVSDSWVPVPFPWSIGFLPCTLLSKECHSHSGDGGIRQLGIYQRRQAASILPRRSQELCLGIWTDTAKDKAYSVLSMHQPAGTESAPRVLHNLQGILHLY